MVINVDNQGMEAVKQLCDLALKSKGLEVIEGVVLVLNSAKLIVKDDVKEVPAA